MKHSHNILTKKEKHVHIITFLKHKKLCFDCYGLYASKDKLNSEYDAAIHNNSNSKLTLKENCH